MCWPRRTQDPCAPLGRCDEANNPCVAAIHQKCERLTPRHATGLSGWRLKKAQRKARSEADNKGINYDDYIQDHYPELVGAEGGDAVTPAPKASGAANKDKGPKEKSEAAAQKDAPANDKKDKKDSVSKKGGKADDAGADAAPDATASPSSNPGKAKKAKKELEKKADEKKEKKEKKEAANEYVVVTPEAPAKGAKSKGGKKGKGVKKAAPDGEAAKTAKAGGKDKAAGASEAASPKTYSWQKGSKKSRAEKMEVRRAELLAQDFGESPVLLQVGPTPFVLVNVG